MRYTAADALHRARPGRHPRGRHPGDPGGVRRLRTGPARGRRARRRRGAHHDVVDDHPDPATAARSRCRTGRSPRPRRRWPGSSSSTCPTSTPRSAGPRSAPAPSTASSRCAPPPPRSSTACGRTAAACDRSGRGGAAPGAALVRAELAARTSYGRLLALLAAGTHDIAGAEDALADAFERALRTWPVDGVPDRPDAWLLTVARNRQRDRGGSAEATRTTALDPDAHAPVHLDDVDPDAVPDRRLELMLVCAHPAIAAGRPHPAHAQHRARASPPSRSPARYAVPARTMATRLVRAKRRIRDNRIPFRVPDRSQLPERMDAVLAAVYAAYVIEWSTGPGERDLPPEALHLAEVLAELVPDDPEVRGPGRPRRAVGRAAAGPHRGGRGVRAARRAGPRARGTPPSSPGHTSTSGRRTPPGSSAATSSRRPCRPCTARGGRPGAPTGPPCSSCTARWPSSPRAWAARRPWPPSPPRWRARRPAWRCSTRTRSARRASSPRGRPAPSCCRGSVDPPRRSAAYDHAIALTHDACRAPPPRGPPRGPAPLTRWQGGRMSEPHGIRLLLLADTHLPRRARDLPDAVWAEVERADVVVHAGDWVEVDLLDRLEARARAVLGCWGNNDGPDAEGPAARGRAGHARRRAGGRRARDRRRRSDGGSGCGRPTRTSTSSSSGTATSLGTQRIPDSGCSTPGRRPTAAEQPHCTYLTARLGGGVVEDVVLHRLPPVAR